MEAGRTALKRYKKGSGKRKEFPSQGDRAKGEE